MNTFLRLTLVLGLAASSLFAQDTNGTAGTSNPAPCPPGLQLYSLRESFKKDVAGTLDQVKKFGFSTVELAGTYGKTPAELATLLDRRGLQAIGGHFSYDRFKNDPEGVAKEAQELGLAYAGCAWIPHTGNFDEKTCREAVVVFNHAGAVLARHRIQFYYHTHGYEFQPFQDGTLFDLLVESTNPRFVGFEMDVMWVVFPGQDPVQLLNKYPGRWKLMHLKDVRKGVPGNLSGGTDPNNDVVLGTGQTDWPAVLKAAHEAGVKWYFIEDESATVLDQIPQHLAYLKQFSW